MRQLLREPHVETDERLLPRPPTCFVKHKAVGTGGLRQQLNSLRAGLHPVTGLRLPESSGSTALGSGTYSKLRPIVDVDPDFFPYVPAQLVASVSSGQSAEMKRRLMRGRVLCKISSRAAELRRQRRNEIKVEVREVIRSFLDNADDGGQQEAAELEEPGNCSDEEFWANLPVASNREEHILNVPTQPDRLYPGKKVQSRAEALGSVKLRAEDVVNHG